MTVQDLIYELGQMNPDAEVRLAIHPGWPFEYDLIGAVEVYTNEYINANTGEMENDGEQRVYLEQGDQLGYLPESVKELLGW